VSTDRIDTLNTEAWEVGLREPARSRELAAEALGLSRREGYPRGEALATRTLGYCHLISSELEPALQKTSEALEKLRAVGDLGGQATALNTLGILYASLGDFERSLVYALECLDLNREVGDRRGEAWAYTEIGNVHLAVAEFSQARENFESALEIFEALSYKPGCSRVWNLLGSIHSSTGAPEKALACHEKSLEISEGDGLDLATAGNARILGRIHQSRGDVGRARTYLERAIAVSEGAPLVELRADVRVSLAHLEIEEGRFDEAHRLLNDALELVRTVSLVQTEGQIHEALSSLYEQKGELSLALSHHKEFHRLRGAMFDEEGRTRLKNLQIRLGVEQAEKQAEIERLRFVELAGMQTELVQSEKMALLGRLVAGLSHEMNTPIGVVNSNASLAARAVAIMRAEGVGEETNERVRRAMGSLISAHEASAAAGARLEELLHSLKGYARLDEAELQRADMSRCVKDALSLFETQLPERIRLESELESIPEITCRPGQLNQVFMTILVNARDAIDADGEIHVSCGHASGEATIVIKDNGRGIADDKISKLFDIDFSRKDSQVRLRMGLSHAKSIVEKHRGKIEVSSQAGRGTCFTIRVPLHEPVVPYFGGGRLKQG